MAAIPHIVAATEPADYAAFSELIVEYTNWCRARYKDDAWFVDKAFGHQFLLDELKKLSTVFGPPNGRTLLLRSEDKYLGCGAYKRLDEKTCEMKRVFLRPETRGLGLGRILCTELMREAKEDGYSFMRLDTGGRLVEAIKAYKSLGFRDCAPYNDYPPDLMPYIVFMEAPL